MIQIHLVAGLVSSASHSTVKQLSASASRLLPRMLVSLMVSQGFSYRVTLAGTPVATAQTAEAGVERKGGSAVATFTTIPVRTHINCGCHSRRDSPCDPGSLTTSLCRATLWCAVGRVGPAVRCGVMQQLPARRQVRHACALSKRKGQGWELTDPLPVVCPGIGGGVGDMQEQAVDAHAAGGEEQCRPGLPAARRGPGKDKRKRLHAMSLTDTSASSMCPVALPACSQVYADGELYK